MSVISARVGTLGFLEQSGSIIERLATAGMSFLDMPKSLNEQVSPIRTRNSCNKPGQTAAASKLRTSVRLGSRIRASPANLETAECQVNSRHVRYTAANALP